VPGAAQACGQTPDHSRFTPWEADLNRGPVPQHLETAVHNLWSRRGCVPSSPSRGSLFCRAAELSKLKLPTLKRKHRLHSHLCSFQWCRERVE